MAQVYSLPDSETWEYDATNGYGGYKKFLDEQDKRFEALEKDPFSVYGDFLSKANDKHGVVGSIIRFGVADDCARYLVISASPLQVCHIPYMDGYHADNILLRGLNLTDVKRMVK